MNKMIESSNNKVNRDLTVKIVTNKINRMNMNLINN